MKRLKEQPYSSFQLKPCYFHALAAQVIKVLCKVPCHYICTLSQGIYGLNLEPVFLDL